MSEYDYRIEVSIHGDIVKVDDPGVTLLGFSHHWPEGAASTVASLLHRVAQQVAEGGSVTIVRPNGDEFTIVGRDEQAAAAQCVMDDPNEDHQGEPCPVHPVHPEPPEIDPDEAWRTLAARGWFGLPFEEQSETITAVFTDGERVEYHRPTAFDGIEEYPDPYWYEVPNSEDIVVHEDAFGNRTIEHPPDNEAVQ